MSKPMTFDKCRESIGNWTKKNGVIWDDKKIDDIARIVAQESPKMTPNQLLDHLLDLLVKSAETSALAKKNAQLATLRKFVQDSQNLNVTIGGRTKSQNLIDLIEGGSTAAGEGLNKSALSHAATYESMALEAFHNALPDDVERVAITGKVDTDIYKTLAVLQSLGEGEQLTPELIKKHNLSGIAVQVSRAAHDTFAFLFEAKKTFAPHIERAVDYIVKRSWDESRLLTVASTIEKSRETFVADMMEHYGDKSFPSKSAADKMESFGDMFDKIVSGRFHDAEANGDVSARFVRERVLRANSPEAFATMAAKYGYGNFMEAFVRNLKQTSRELGVAQKFGPMPDMYLEMSQKFLAKNAPEEHHIYDGTSYQDRLNSAFYNATHLGDSVSRTMTGKVADGVRQLGWITAGGNTSIRSIQDSAAIGAVVSTFQSGGSAIANTVSMVAKTIGYMTDKKAREEVLKKTLLFSHAGMNALAESFGYETRKVGIGYTDKALWVGSQLGQKLSKWSGVVIVSDSMRAAAATIQSNIVAEAVEDGWGKLTERQIKEFSRYQIGKAEFDVFSKVLTSAKDLPGSPVMISTAKIMALPAEEILAYGKAASILSDSPNVVRFELIGRMGTMFNDLANIATSTPGVAEKTIMYGRAGKDGWGAIRHILWQFRGSALVNMRTYARVAHSGEGLVGKMGAAGSLAAANLVLYALGDASIQILNGKTPQTEVDLPYFGRLAAGAGWGGVGGDAIIGTVVSENPSVGGLAEGLLGFGFSSVGRPAVDLVRLGLGAAAGEPVLDGKIERAVNSAVLRKIPLISTLPVVSGVYNMHVAGSIREWLHSTAMLDEEMRMLKRGQEYWLPK